MVNKTYVPRELEKNIEKWLDKKQILVIRGPRQCGKTTLLKQLKNKYEKKGVSLKNIHEFTMEDEFEKQEFEKDVKKYFSFYINNGGKHIFLIDEIQYVKNAGKLLKLIYDTMDVKIIVTGSSSLDLNNIGKFLVGRAIFFDLYPFNFREFLYSKDKKMHDHYLKEKINIKALNKARLNKKEILCFKKLQKYFEEYLTFGGYPDIVLEKNIEIKKTLLKNLFFTYLEKDIIKLYGLKYKEKVMNLIRYLASVTGEVIKYDSICNAVNMHFSEVKEALQILEDTFIVKQIRPYHKNLTTELKKNPKIYFYDAGMRNMILNRFEFSYDEKGRLFEWNIFNLLKDEDLLYWRTTNKSEVDFVYRINYNEVVPIEVKSSLKITRSFRSFLKEYKPKRGIIANNDRLEEIKIEKSKILIVPHALLSA